MTTLTVARAAQLPRVNLLPPEIEASAKLSHLKRILVFVLVAALALVGVGYFFAMQQVSSAQSSLDAATAAGTALQAEAAKYAEVPQVQAELSTAQTNLATAMASEVRFSFLLNDLSLTIPSGVRLSDLTVTNVSATAQMTPGTTLPSTYNGNMGVGTVTYQGKATSADAVASWLRTQSQEGLLNPQTSTITRDQGGTVGRVYTFSSDATVPASMLSGRYQQAGQ